VQNFRYDSLDRLTHAWTDGVGAGIYDRTYVYNAIGNLTYRSDIGYYDYPDSGQPRPHAATTAGDNTYHYDLNGNMDSRTENTLTYQQQFDVENRLAQVSGAADVTFVYDGDGNLVQKADASGTTVYIGGYYEVTLPAWAITGTVQDGPRGLPLQGVAVQLWGLNGSTQEHLATATTAADGSFAFDEQTYCDSALCWRNFAVLEIREVDLGDCESSGAVASSGGTVVNANTIRFAVQGTYGGNRFEDKRLLEWRFNGRVVNAAEVGLAGVRVTLLRHQSWWRTADSVTTAGDGNFSLAYSSYYGDLYRSAFQRRISQLPEHQFACALRLHRETGDGFAPDLPVGHGLRVDVGCLPLHADQPGQRQRGGAGADRGRELGAGKPRGGTGARVSLHGTGGEGRV